ncbi:hypothetical protein E2C01_037307 [Portunus trituberculatus]|uniref:Uncharacterized protein n=1 Tax=Portunus trituberculatus TaxID=210409 RepID=A0A5B7FGQ5_PORTR|nr:hypothetical protein [Portunus trituberculatus]
MTGPGLYAHVAPSPYLHLSNFSLKLCTFIADTTSSLKVFHVPTHLCGKLYVFNISQTSSLPQFLNMRSCASNVIFFSQDQFTSSDRY